MENQDEKGNLTNTRENPGVARHRCREEQNGGKTNLGSSIRGFGGKHLDRG